MDSGTLAIFALGFTLGLKHALEPDHVIAVSTLLHVEGRFRRLVATGLAWGAGHMTTLVLGVTLIGLPKLRLSAANLVFLELPVAAMLLALGMLALRDAAARLALLRTHEHDGLTHSHLAGHRHPHSFAARTGWRGFAVGLVHGLAGSGALLLLVAATLPTLGLGILYALVFGTGSLLGLAAVSAMLALPFSAARQRPRLNLSLTGISGALSIALALGIIAEAVAAGF